jgi:hypothetical protein
MDAKLICQTVGVALGVVSVKKMETLPSGGLTMRWNFNLFANPAT